MAEMKLADSWIYIFIFALTHLPSESGVICQLERPFKTCRRTAAHADVVRIAFKGFDHFFDQLISVEFFSH
jgi:hypothetical protein